MIKEKIAEEIALHERNATAYTFIRPGMNPEQVFQMQLAAHTHQGAVLALKQLLTFVETMESDEAH